MNEQLPLPVTGSILLADQIIVEAETAKKTLVGVYSNIFTAKVPARRHLSIYAELTDVQGAYDLRLELVQLVLLLLLLQLLLLLLLLLLLPLWMQLQGWRAERLAV